MSHSKEEASKANAAAAEVKEQTETEAKKENVTRIMKNDVTINLPR